MCKQHTSSRAKKNQTSRKSEKELLNEEIPTKLAGNLDIMWQVLRT